MIGETHPYVRENEYILRVPNKFPLFKGKKKCGHWPIWVEII